MAHMCWQWPFTIGARVVNARHSLLKPASFARAFSRMLLQRWDGSEADGTTMEQQDLAERTIGDCHKLLHASENVLISPVGIGGCGLHPLPSTAVLRFHHLFSGST